MFRYILILLFCYNLIYANQINLTTEEENYLKLHPVIKVHNEANWAPFNFNIDGKPQGFSIDYMNLLASKLGIKVEYISGYSWKEFMSMLQTPKLDLMINIVKNEQRSKTISFSDKFNTIQNAIYVNINNKDFHTLEDLNNKTVALVDGFFSQTFIKKHYPKIKQVLVKNQLEALKLLSLSKVDAVIAEKIIADYIISQHLIPSLVATEYIKDKKLTANLRLGSSKEDRVLIDILNKVQKSLTKVEKDLLQNKWFGVNILSKDEKNNKIKLSEDEQSYLKNKKELTVCVKKGWLPYESFENGKFIGISADFLKIYSLKLGIPLKIIVSQNQTESLKLIYNSKCDIKPLLAINSKTKVPYTATKEYFKDSVSLVTRIEQPFVQNLTYLKNKNIAIVKGYKRFTKFITKEYPDIKLQEVNTISEALELVATGKIFGYIGTSLTSSHEIQKNYSTKLKIVNNFKDFRFGIGISNSQKILLDIFNKTIDKTTNEERMVVHNKWISTTLQETVDYTYLWYFLVTILLIILFFIYRQKSLNRYNKTLKSEIEEATKLLNDKNYKLEESIDNFQNILDLTVEMIVFTKDGQVIDINKSGLEMMGYSDKSEVLGKPILDFLPQNQIEKVMNSLEESYSAAYELTLIKKDGTYIHTSNSARDIIKNGEKIRMSTLVDLTQFKQRDEAIASSKAKSEFLANMSHEIRTPLNAIMGFIDLLIEKEDDKEKLSYLNTINKSSNSLVGVINDILDFSKIESGKLNIEYIDFNPIDELNTTKDLFKAKCEEKSINLHTNFINLPSSLSGDILRIKQVINNLLSNAVKFTQENKNIYLNIEYKDNFLNVSVKDEGIGISKEYQKQIFNAFTQEDNSTTRKFGGTGLGLTISYNIVMMMGTELKLKSELNSGSEFYFSIPLTIGKEIKTLKENNTLVTLDGNVLLVEDNKANQMFMKVVLKKLNLKFDIANDGIEAIEQFKKNKYDTILMDENMPNMNGIEATRQILVIEKENNLKHTPIIALTANALKGDRERFLGAGMDEYLTKPVNKKKLVVILENFLNKEN